MSGLTRQEAAEFRRMQKVIRDQKKAARKSRQDRTHAPVKPTRGREIDNTYLAWLRRQPCRIAGLHGHRCGGPIQAAHLRYADLAVGRSNPGFARKSDDRWATSLCADAHHEQHGTNEREWWASYGLDGSQVAMEQHAAYTSAAEPGAGGLR